MVSESGKTVIDLSLPHVTANRYLVNACSDFEAFHKARLRSMLQSQSIDER
jgi:hypothetical protein